MSETKELPTKPGHYWMRPKGGSAWLMVRIWEQSGELQVQYFGEDGWHRLSYRVGASWSARLREPKARRKAHAK